MKFARLASTLAAGALAASLSTTVAAPASAAMTPEQEKAATAALVEMATFVDGYTTEHGQLPDEEVFEAEYPFDETSDFYFAYWAPSAQDGFCLSAFRYEAFGEPDLAVDDLRFYDSGLDAVFIPTEDLLDGKDPATTPCATAMREQLVIARQVLLKSDVKNAAMYVEVRLTDNLKNTPTMKRLRKDGFRSGKGNTLKIKWGQKTGRYCLRATNPDAGLGAGEFVWFDSGFGTVTMGPVPTGKRSVCKRVF